MGFRNSTPRCIPQIIESRDSNSHLHTSIYNSMTHQKVEITQIPMKRWMDKKNIVYTYSLFSLKKEWDADTCSNIDEPWKHYANWNKPDTKVQISYDLTYMKY